MLLSTLARDCPSLSNRYAGTAPSGTSLLSLVFVWRCSCILSLQHIVHKVTVSSESNTTLVHSLDLEKKCILFTYVFFICIFSSRRFLLYSLALKKITVWTDCVNFTTSNNLNLTMSRRLWGCGQRLLLSYVIIRFEILLRLSCCKNLSGTWHIVAHWLTSNFQFLKVLLQAEIHVWLNHLHTPNSKKGSEMQNAKI